MAEEYRFIFRKHFKDLAVLEFEPTPKAIAFYIAALTESWPIVLLSPEQCLSNTHLIKLYQPKIIFSSSHLNSKYPEYSEVSDIDHLFLLHKQTHFKIDKTKTALLLSTSGSTGSPKFVQLTLKNLISNAISISHSLEIKKSDIAITSLPLHYSYGLSVLNSHLITGASLVLSTHSIVENEFWKTLDKFKVTFFAGVPYTYEILNRLGPKYLEQAKTITKYTQAGGKLKSTLIKYFFEWCKMRDKKFYVMYGQTEATARMTCLDPVYLPEKLGSVGIPISGGKCEIINKDTRTGVGEILYKGPNVMLGYAYSRNDLLSEDMLDGKLLTGDLGYLDSEGFLFITGRISRFAKISGVRISLDEIEQLIACKGSFAIISKDERIIVIQENLEINDEDLKFILSQKLSIHPSFIIVKKTDNLPRKSNGKIDYKLLEESF